MPNGTSSSTQLGPPPRLGAEPGHRDEAVEIPRPARGRFVVDRVTAAEQSGHHRLGDARREAGSDRGVRGRPAVGEHLDPDVDGGGVSRCDLRRALTES